MSYLVTRAADGEIIPAGPSVSTVKVPGAATQGRASVIEMVLDPGWDGPPPHSHADIDHIWYVVAGRVILRLGDETVELMAGDVAWVPHGEAHSFATGAVGATLLECDAPRPLDGYFRDLAEAFPRGTRPDPAIVSQIMARHDTYVI